jgi:hypothetical protein
MVGANGRFDEAPSATKIARQYIEEGSTVIPTASCPVSWCVLATIVAFSLSGVSMQCSPGDVAEACQKEVSTRPMEALLRQDLFETTQHARRSGHWASEPFHRSDCTLSPTVFWLDYCD